MFLRRSHASAGDDWRAAPVGPPKRYYACAVQVLYNSLERPKQGHDSLGAFAAMLTLHSFPSSKPGEHAGQVILGVRHKA